MRKIKTLKMLTDHVPAQYEGYLETGEFIYVRVRFGMGEVRIGSEEEKKTWTMKTVAATAYENSYKGSFEGKELEELLEKAGLDYSELEIIPITEEDRRETVERVLKFLQDNANTEGEPIFLTTDKDILNNHSSSARLMQLMRQINEMEKINPT